MPPEDTTFRFDPARMAEAARLAPGYVSSFDNLLEQIEKEMAAIKECWKSTAADHYQRRYDAEMAAIKDCLEVFHAYPKRLNEIVGIDTAADKLASNIAASIEQAQWAEV